MSGGRGRGSYGAPPAAAKPAPAPKPTPAAPKKPQCKALYDFQAQQAGDLGFKTGDIITIVDDSKDWWTGELNGKQGVFPGNYTQKI